MRVSLLCVACVLVPVFVGGCVTRPAGSQDASVDAWVRPPRDAAADSGPPTFDAGPPMDAYLAPVRFRDGATSTPGEGEVVCGGGVCGAGQGCCLLTTRCFDLSRASECEVPPGEHPEACASNADCSAGEYCARHDHYVEDREFRLAGACGGALGRCVPRAEADACGGSQPVCGCDGRTYPHRCAASRAGVRVSWPIACGDVEGQRDMCSSNVAMPCPERQQCIAGFCRSERPVLACGLDTQCPEGWNCCAVAGVCVPSSCPECCFAPPSTTRLPCILDAHCVGLDTRNPGAYFCDGAGCGTQGGCRRRPTCSPGDRPVCGCDGRSYTTECYAAQAGTRVAHTGACE